jgi:L-rhamnose mutarotase
MHPRFCGGHRVVNLFYEPAPLRVLQYWIVEGESGVKRAAFVSRVKQGRIEEYKKYHREVWPEMLDALRRAGWHKYSLFLKDDGLLVGYFETPHDFDTAQNAIAAELISHKWHEYMLPLFEAPEGGGSAFEVELEEVFHLD